MQTGTNLPQAAMEKALADLWLPSLVACEDIGSHLAYVDASAKEVRVNALRRELEAFDDMLAEDAPNGWRPKGRRRRTIVTLLGEVAYMRRTCVGPSGACHAPLDEATGIRTRSRLAPDAFPWVARTAAEASYRKTAKAFPGRTGARMSPWLVMAAVHGEGGLPLPGPCGRALGGDALARAPWAGESLFAGYDGLHVNREIRRALPDGGMAGHLAHMAADGSAGMAMGQPSRLVEAGGDGGRPASLSACLPSAAGMLGGGEGPSPGTTGGAPTPRPAPPGRRPGEGRCGHVRHPRPHRHRRAAHRARPWQRAPRRGAGEGAEAV